MNKFVIITLLVNIIFAVNQGDYFLEANKYAPTHIYAAGFIVCVIYKVSQTIMEQTENCFSNRCASVDAAHFANGK